MQPLSPGGLLDIWERGRERHPIDRAVLLLGAALPGWPRESLADVPVGRRDAAILDLWCATFGPEARAFLDCPSCGERLEFAFDGRAFRLPVQGERKPLVIDTDGLRFRVPASRDLACIADENDLERAARTLLERCWLPDGGAPEWSEALLETVEARFGEADPQGDVTLALGCDACAHAWQTELDIAGFFWEDLEARAQRLLDEVHLLARAYGWPEGEVLALSDVRRQAYIERLQA